MVAPFTVTSNQLSTDPVSPGVLPTSPVNARLTIVPLLSTTIVLLSEARLPTKLELTVPVIIASPRTSSLAVGVYVPSPTSPSLSRVKPDDSGYVPSPSGSM